MPFGLMNAPAVFQRVLQQVLSVLNPIEGPAFVAVYLDDVLEFSETMQDHLVHLIRYWTGLPKQFEQLKSCLVQAPVLS